MTTFYPARQADRIVGWRGDPVRVTVTGPQRGQPVSPRWHWSRQRRPKDDRLMAATRDNVVIRGRHVDDAVCTGIIIEVGGPAGAPPYAVRSDDGHEALVFPGPDCVITPPVE